MVRVSGFFAWMWNLLPTSYKADNPSHRIVAWAITVVIICVLLIAWLLACLLKSLDEEFTPNAGSLLDYSSRSRCTSLVEHSDNEGSEMGALVPQHEHAVLSAGQSRRVPAAAHCSLPHVARSCHSAWPSSSSARRQVRSGGRCQSACCRGEPLQRAMRKSRRMPYVLAAVGARVSMNHH